MKKLFTLSALTLMSAGAMAQAYVEPRVAQLKASYASESVTLSGAGVVVGADIGDGFALEAELMVTGVNDNYYGIPYNVTITTLGAFAKYTMPLTEKVNVYGRLGMVNTNVKETLSYHNFRFVHEEDETTMAYGVGMAIGVTPTTSITVSYTSLGKPLDYNVSTVSAGLNIKF